MFKTLRIPYRPAPPVVLSLLVQAQMPQSERKQSSFEVLVRHLLDRLLTSESLGAGEESATRVLQMAYAVALPGVVGALFLFPLYHSLFLGPRRPWAQASDHFFYLTYAFVVMGLVTVLLWDLLFPDLLDVFILTSLPIAARKLLLARVTALTIFFGVALIGTNGLGVIFLPAVADLHGMWMRHFAAHAVSVGLCGLFITASLIALQGLFICALGQRITRRVAPAVQAIGVVVLLTTLFLSPLVAHFLKALLESNNSAVRWFPPFWFLGIYERFLWGASAPALFASLAQIGFRLTGLAVAIALLTYPLAYTRRTRQVIEGAAIRPGVEWGSPLNALLHATVLRIPSGRAIYHLIGQTVWRTQKIRLLLAVFGGLGLAMTMAELVLIGGGHGPIMLGLSQQGARYAVPIMAFWTVAGLRAVVLSPVGKPGSWAFRVIHGRPKLDHLRASKRWVALSTSIVTVATVLVLHKIVPPELPGPMFLLEQIILALSLSILLTDIFFLRIEAIPFTEAPPYSVDNLSYVVVTYFILYPVFVLKTVEFQAWIEMAPRHLIVAILLFVDVHILLRYLHTRRVKADARRLDMEEEENLIPGEMGLRN
jgi:hypothetical protein